MHNDKNFYGGCHDQNCKKKLQQETHSYVCMSCNKQYQEPHYYYTLSVRVKDCSSEYWIDVFGNLAEKLMKVTAGEYRDILISQNSHKIKEITNNVEFKTFSFLIKPKLHFYNSLPKKKLYAYRVENFETVPEARRLAKKLKLELAL